MGAGIALQDDPRLRRTHDPRHRPSEIRLGSVWDPSAPLAPHSGHEEATGATSHWGFGEMVVAPAALGGAWCPGSCARGPDPAPSGCDEPGQWSTANGRMRATGRTMRCRVSTDIAALTPWSSRCGVDDGDSSV